jgi:hypothetical protein
MNMTAEVYIQKNVQSDSGAMTRQWVYDKTISCRAMVPASKAGRSVSDGKSYGTGSQGYAENLDIKLQTEVRLSKRFRISGITSANGEKTFLEYDKISLEDTIFDIVSMHPALDPFGKIAYYECNLRRAQIQNNDIISV